MFVKICEKLGVRKFQNGTNPNNTLWKRLTNTCRIKTSGHEVELDKTGMCEGMFDDVEATVLQYAHTLYTFKTIKLGISLNRPEQTETKKNQIYF